MQDVDINEKIQNRESFLLGNDGQYLGKLSLNRFDRESITNSYGLYGSKYSSTSIWNKYSTYGSKYSSLSPFNKYTSTPPRIYLHGVEFGYLTKNKYVGKNIDPEIILDWLVEKNLKY